MMLDVIREYQEAEYICGRGLISEVAGSEILCIQVAESETDW